MLLRQSACIILILALFTVAWGRKKVTLTDLLAKSDAVYYLPSEHGVKDLAVDIVIEQWATDPIGKNALVSFYYAGDNNQRMDVTNIPEEYSAFRKAVLELLSPLGQYIIPRSSSASFSGMKLKLLPVTRQIIGFSGTDYYDVIGSVPDTPENKAGMKEYHILLDKDGLVHNIENIFKNGTKLAASIKNVKIKDGNQWVISTLNTRLANREGDVWKIEQIDYDVIDGYTLPVRCTVKFRDNYNKPVAGKDDLTIGLTNYRINKGIAAAAITEINKLSSITEPAPAN